MTSGATVSCPAPKCDYGDEGGPAVFHGRTMAVAIRRRNEHIRSAHPGFKPQTGSALDRHRARLD